MPLLQNLHDVSAKLWPDEEISPRLYVCSEMLPHGSQSSPAPTVKTSTYAIKKSFALFKVWDYSLKICAVVKSLEETRRRKKIGSNWILI